MHKAITYSKIKQLFDYGKDGFLIRKTNKKKVGTKSTNGYMQMAINNKSFYIHRLVWMWHNGYFPENIIDHINRNVADNRIENLREVSFSCNLRNSKNRKDNTSGVKGIYWNKRGKRWMFRININGKEKYLGLYIDFDEAVLVRLAAEQCLDWSYCNSNSSAYQYAIKNKLIKKGRKV